MLTSIIYEKWQRNADEKQACREYGEKPLENSVYGVLDEVFVLIMFTKRQKCFKVVPLGKHARESSRYQQH